MVWVATKFCDVLGTQTPKMYVPATEQITVAVMGERGKIERLTFDVSAQGAQILQGMEKTYRDAVAKAGKPLRDLADRTSGVRSGRGRPRKSTTSPEEPRAVDRDEGGSPERSDEKGTTDEGEGGEASRGDGNNPDDQQSW